MPSASAMEAGQMRRKTPIHLIQTEGSIGLAAREGPLRRRGEAVLLHPVEERALEIVGDEAKRSEGVFPHLDGGRETHHLEAAVDGPFVRGPDLRREAVQPAAPIVDGPVE